MFEEHAAIQSCWLLAAIFGFSLASACLLNVPRAAGILPLPTAPPADQEAHQGMSMAVGDRGCNGL